MNDQELAALLRRAAMFIGRDPRYGHCEHEADHGYGVELRSRLLAEAESRDPLEAVEARKEAVRRYGPTD